MAAQQNYSVLRLHLTQAAFRNTNPGSGTQADGKPAALRGRRSSGGALRGAPAREFEVSSGLAHTQ